jgi:hypothetical protein
MHLSLSLFTFVLISASCCLSNREQFANEKAAIERLRQIHKKETEYYATHAEYTAQPRALGMAPESAYLFQLRSTRSGYILTASPSNYLETGRRTFYSDQTGVIHQNWGHEPATAASKVIH